MTGTPFFAKPCPTCGRMAQIKVSYLGRQVQCQHCGGEFKATSPDSESAALDDPVQYWINFTQHDVPETVFGDQTARIPR